MPAKGQFNPNARVDKNHKVEHSEDGTVEIHIGEYVMKTDPESYQRILERYTKLYVLLNAKKKPYVHGTVRGGGKEVVARFLTNCPPGKVVDHINGDSLDNRITNLRILSRADNLRNSTRKNKYGRGVRKRVVDGRYDAYILLGTYDTPEEAQAAYREAMEKLFPGIVQRWD